MFINASIILTNLSGQANRRPSLHSSENTAQFTRGIAAPLEPPEQISVWNCDDASNTTLPCQQKWPSYINNLGHFLGWIVNWSSREVKGEIEVYSVIKLTVLSIFSWHQQRDWPDTKPVRSGLQFCLQCIRWGKTGHTKTVSIANLICAAAFYLSQIKRKE